MQKKKRVKKPNSLKKRSFDYGRNIKIVNSTPICKKAVNEFKEELYLIKYNALESMLSNADRIIEFLNTEIRKEYEYCEFHHMTKEQMIDFSTNKNGIRIFQHYIDELEGRIRIEVNTRYRDMTKESRLEEIGVRMADLCEYHNVKFLTETGLPSLVPLSVCASIATHEMNYMQNFSNELADDLNKKSQLIVTGMINQLKKDVYNNLMCADLTIKEEIQVEELEPIKEKFEYKQKTYKELNDLAESKGWKYIRSHGDHGIFKHDNKEMLLIIPQGRVIGKGLQIFIEKSI